MILVAGLACLGWTSLAQAADTDWCYDTNEFADDCHRDCCMANPEKTLTAKARRAPCLVKCKVKSAATWVAGKVMSITEVKKLVADAKDCYGKAKQFLSQAGSAAQTLNTLSTYISWDVTQLSKVGEKLKGALSACWSFVKSVGATAVAGVKAAGGVVLSVAKKGLCAIVGNTACELIAQSAKCLVDVGKQVASAPAIVKDLVVWAKGKDSDASSASKFEQTKVEKGLAECQKYLASLKSTASSLVTQMTQCVKTGKNCPFGGSTGQQAADVVLRCLKDTATCKKWADTIAKCLKDEKWCGDFGWQLMQEKVPLKKAYEVELKGNVALSYEGVVIKGERKIGGSIERTAKTQFDVEFKVEGSGGVGVGDAASLNVAGEIVAGRKYKGKLKKAEHVMPFAKFVLAYTTREAVRDVLQSIIPGGAASMSVLEPLVERLFKVFNVDLNPDFLARLKAAGVVTELEGSGCLGVTAKGELKLVSASASQSGCLKYGMDTEGNVSLGAELKVKGSGGLAYALAKVAGKAELEVTGKGKITVPCNLSTEEAKSGVNLFVEALTKCFSGKKKTKLEAEIEGQGTVEYSASGGVESGGAGGAKGGSVEASISKVKQANLKVKLESEEDLQLSVSSVLKSFSNSFLQTGKWKSRGTWELDLAYGTKGEGKATGGGGMGGLSGGLEASGMFKCPKVCSGTLSKASFSNFIKGVKDTLAEAKCLPCPGEVTEAEEEQPPGEEAQAPAVPLAKGQEPKAGQKVTVEFEGNWYPATVLRVQGGKYCIHYDDYDSSWDECVDRSRLGAAPAGVQQASQPAPSAKAAVGQKVSVEFEGNWYPATVLRIDGGKYCIHYDGYDASSDECVEADRLKPR
jgi:hypothetical protein